MIRKVIFFKYPDPLKETKLNTVLDDYYSFGTNVLEKRLNDDLDLFEVVVYPVREPSYRVNVMARDSVRALS